MFMLLSYRGEDYRIQCFIASQNFCFIFFLCFIQQLHKEFFPLSVCR